MTPSEEYVARLCQKSFLPFWSFPNPEGKKEKELCDLIVVCGNHIIIISVKEIRVTSHADPSVQYDRWFKKAILKSTDQIHGAERYIGGVDEILSYKGKSRIKLPEKECRIIHRIAIAFGSKPDFPIPTRDFGKGYVHVLDEQSTELLLDELDTLKDFTNYLTAKEKFANEFKLICKYEADFLALYLQTGLEFDAGSNSALVIDDLWKSYEASQEYADWRKEIEVSYIWDRMIEKIHSYHVNEETNSERRFELENSLRVINLEPRMDRIELGKLLDDAITKKVSARMLLPREDSKHMYVFIPLSDHNWESKENELQLRCLVARFQNPQVSIVVGVSIGTNKKGESMFDICYFNLPTIDNNFCQIAMKIQDNLGYFKNPSVTKRKFLK